jgi:hypothetical protein
MLVVPSLSKSFRHLKQTQPLPTSSEKVTISNSKSDGNGSIENGSVSKSTSHNSSQEGIISQAIQNSSGIRPIMTVSQDPIPSKPLPVHIPTRSREENDASATGTGTDPAFGTIESQNIANEEIWKNLVINSSPGLTSNMSVKLKTG